MSSILTIFRRKKPAPLSCTTTLDPSGLPLADSPTHTHTSACFIDFSPLAIIELFQSQGCQACPPAIPGILAATASPNVLLLSYNVTIFDHTGWKDTLGSALADRRQRAYVKKWGRNSLYTPQLVVNGVVDGNGAGGEAEMMELVGKARGMYKNMGWNVYLDVNDSEVRIDSDRAEAGAHDVLVVVYESGEQVVKVGKGGNKGKKIRHRNVVRQLVKIGEWSGGDVTLALPVTKASMKQGDEAAVLLQAGAGGPIVAAVKV